MSRFKAGDRGGSGNPPFDENFWGTLLKKRLVGGQGERKLFRTPLLGVKAFQQVSLGGKREGP